MYTHQTSTDEHKSSDSLFIYRSLQAILLSQYFSLIIESIALLFLVEELKQTARTMCMNAAEWIPAHVSQFAARKTRSRKSKVRVRGLTTRRRCEDGTEKDMELKNLKLYLENRSIIEENEKLRKKASLLHQENLALMSEFQKKFAHLDRFSATLFLLHHKH